MLQTNIVSNFSVKFFSAYTEKNLTLKSNLLQRFESIMCFVVELIKIRVHSTRKLSFISIYIKIQFNWGMGKNLKKIRDMCFLKIYRLKKIQTCSGI